MRDGNSPGPSQQGLWKQQRGQLKWRAAIEAGPCGAVILPELRAKLNATFPFALELNFAFYPMKK